VIFFMLERELCAEVWNASIDIPRDSPSHHKGAIGSILAAMFGYAVDAEMLG